METRSGVSWLLPAPSAGVLANSGRSKAGVRVNQGNPFSGLIEPFSGPAAQILAGKSRGPIDKRFAVLLRRKPPLSGVEHVASPSSTEAKPRLLHLASLLFCESDPAVPVSIKLVSADDPNH